MSFFRLFFISLLFKCPCFLGFYFWSYFVLFSPYFFERFQPFPFSMYNLFKNELQISNSDPNSSPKSFVYPIPYGSRSLGWPKEHPVQYVQLIISDTYCPASSSTLVFLFEIYCEIKWYMELPVSCPGQIPGHWS